MDPISEPPVSVAFGRFRVVPHRRELIAEGRRIKLGGRAFDLLMALIQARGEVVSKDVLMARVWPERIVEKNALEAQIVAIRKAFGGDRELVRTVAGRGYQFTGDIHMLHTSPYEPVGAAAAQPAPVLPPTNIPEPISELIGRDAEVAALLKLLGEHRLVTLAGGGGIGKTRLALAVAHRMQPQFPDGVWLAELSPLADPNLVAATVAAAVGLQLGAGEISPQRVQRALANRQMLLVLDTCEHVIDAAAAMAEALLRAGSDLHVIATSREPLRAEGEQIYLVLPLAVPVVEDEDPFQFGAVRLFVERSRASGAHVREDQHHLALAITSICRRLDGIPLAIELAAARASTVGIDALAGRLDDRFDLLTDGRRTAFPRQQTLRATFDWSYELLSGAECLVLRRLAVFAGAFTLPAATAVVANPEIPPVEVENRLSNLAAKSLVVAKVEGTSVRYRLLDTTRAYALEKLDESGEREPLLRCHAEYYRHLFERAEVGWEARPTHECVEDYGWCIDNLRAALDWAFSPEGDVSIGVALTAAAVPLWMSLSLLDECRGRAEQAIAVFGTGKGGDPQREMKLYIALATSSYWGSGVYPRALVGEMRSLWTKVLEIAESLDDGEYQLRSLYGLCVFHLAIGDLQVALEMAQRFRRLAAEKQRRRNDELVGDRLIGLLQHFLGDQASARRHIEHMVANFIPSTPRSNGIIRFQFDQVVAGRIYRARVLWFQGFPNEAVRTASGAIDEACDSNHALSLCTALALGACPIMLWVGDLPAAEHYIAMLLDHSARHALLSWGALGRTFQGVLDTRRGEFGSGLRKLRVGLDEFGVMSEVISMMFLGELAIGFARTGQIADGLAAAEQAIERAERTGARWLFPELLRIRGELLLSQAATGAGDAAQDHFRQALDWARRQGALSLELRAASSLARFMRDQGSCAKAKMLLQSVYARFTEGFETTDLKSAKALLSALE